MQVISPGLDAQSIARRVARQLVGSGAAAVVMTGSQARGDAHKYSDIDLIAILRRKPTGADRDGWLRPYRVVGRTLVAVAWETPATFRKALRSPNLVTNFVPGWREACILTDPDGLAARFKRDADCWTWDLVASACNPHVAEQVAGLAEEVHKLAGTLLRGDQHVAAAQRSILAIHLAGIMAVHHRLLFGTDNSLWSSVDQRMGPHWTQLQSVALSEAGNSLVESCRAALEMYLVAAHEVRPLLSRAQRPVVDQACVIASEVAGL